MRKNVLELATGMWAGDVVDNRFEVERHAGSGGIGYVYRAHDRTTGEAVALKVLWSTAAEQLSRFAREAQVLASLRIPGIAQYVAHGITRTGQPYLAMSWLSGETLAARLTRMPLTAFESVALGIRVATTLGAVHRLGIVHRNLKPSNLLLEGGVVERVTIIDFAVARMTGLERQLTVTVPGAILGTPGYMAPEQARGERRIDARADVFALGCVLYKCLTGRDAVQGTGPLAVLAKAILEEPPRLREIRKDLPGQLDELMARLLAKAPERRPTSGEAVAAELAALQELMLGAIAEPPISSRRTPEITTGERKVMCIVLARGGASDADQASSETEQSELYETLDGMAQRYQGRLEMLDGRSPLIVISGATSPTDLATRAARCALALQSFLGGAPLSLVTGRAEIAARPPVGELLDRAAQLLPTDPPEGGGHAIRVDDVTAGLLGARFEMSEDGGGHWLRGVRDELDAVPQLLGKPTPCVGRDRELALIEAEFRHCVEEPVATAVIVTGTAGIGKTRLRQEFVRTLREQHEDIEVWLGKSDPISAGSAFGLLAHALRNGIGIVEGEPLEERQRKIQARVQQHVPLCAPRVAAFLGELLGTPFPDDNDVQLRAARRNPMLMGDQLRLAWEEFLQAECAKGPVLLVLEELHWGDLPTVTMVDAALRNLRDAPFMVLAMARPEVHQLFPQLWENRRRQEVRLTPLLKRASERLVRHALGDRIGPDLVATLVQRADGNAFYLEEQIRAAARGKTDELPETVLAMVQAGLETLDPEARRVLRAASIFGETFTQDGVAALVGGVQVAPKLLELTQREVIRHGAERASGEVELRFRHALVREAAYGMLTERDRQLGHALAGDWLERAGDADPTALAEHFERGGQRARAAKAFLRAAEQALRGNDLSAALDRAERGVACAAEPATSGALRLIQADAHRWRAEYDLAEQRAVEATTLLVRGSSAWFYAIVQVVTAAGRLSAFDRVERWIDPARDTPAETGALVAKHACIATVAAELELGGRYAEAEALLSTVEHGATDASSRDIQVVARLERARSIRAMTSGDPAAALGYQQAALAALEQAGDRRGACLALTNVAFFQVQLGDFDAADDALRAALTAAERMELPALVANIRQNLGPVLASRGRLDEARETEERALEAYQRMRNPRMEGSARSYLARILVSAGEYEAAEREARAAAELLQSAPPLRGQAVALRASALLVLGRPADALVAAREALSLVDSVGAEEGESLVRLVIAEALAASNETAEATRAIAAARDNLLGRAAKIGDPTWRERFLRNVPENARTLELARQWCEGASASAAYRGAMG